MSATFRMAGRRRAIEIDRQFLLTNLAMLCVVIIWGLNFVSMKHLIGDVGAIKVLLIRVHLAALVFGLFLLIRWRAIPRFPRETWGLLGLMGLFGVVSNQLFVSLGASYLSAAVASMIATSTPVFTAILSRIVLREQLTRRKITGISIAFTGFLVVVLYGGKDAQFSVENALGVFIIALAPLSWTISTILSKPVMMRHDPKIVTAISTVIGSAILLPVLIGQVSLIDDMAGFDRTNWAATFVTSVLSVVVAYTIWYQGLRRLEPTQIAVYVYFVPFFGVVFARLLLDESITRFVLLGGVLILSGVIVTNSGRRPNLNVRAVAVESDPVPPGKPISVPVTAREESNIGK